MAASTLMRGMLLKSEIQFFLFLLHLSPFRIVLRFSSYFSCVSACCVANFVNVMQIIFIKVLLTLSNAFLWIFLLLLRLVNCTTETIFLLIKWTSDPHVTFDRKTFLRINSTRLSRACVNIRCDLFTLMLSNNKKETKLSFASLSFSCHYSSINIKKYFKRFLIYFHSTLFGF